MPNWHAQPRKELKDTLAEVWNDLSLEVADEPPFDEVTGLSKDQLTKHAMEAVASFAERMDEDEVSTPISYMQVYICGFVVGMKYGERRQRSSSPPKSDESMEGKSDG